MILGSGGREHALAWKIAQSPDCEALFAAPGNAGTQAVATNLNLSPTDVEAVAAAVVAHRIDLLVVGPEAPLVSGLRDDLAARADTRQLRVIGPGRRGAELEGSKDFAKKFMDRHGIPTAEYRSFERGEVQQARNFLRELPGPYVLKADGLAAGKGVLIIDNLPEAEREISAMLDGKFGEASRRVVIETFLDGMEVSFFALTDGSDYVLLPEAKDYKRIGEGDQGLNTGGMGAVSPVSFVDEELRRKVEDRIVAPTIQGLRKDDIPYVGFLFFGLMVVAGEPYVIEYNVRMGDPETEVVLPRIQSDLLGHLVAAAEGRLHAEEVVFAPWAASTVMLVSGGYPEKYGTGKTIRGLEEIHNGNSLAFHAGTRSVDGAVQTAGGRVLACTARGADVGEALAASYRLADAIDFEGKYFRRDIGHDL